MQCQKFRTSCTEHDNKWCVYAKCLSCFVNSSWALLLNNLGESVSPLIVQQSYTQLQNKNKFKLWARSMCHILSSFLEASNHHDLHAWINTCPSLDKTLVFQAFCHQSHKTHFGRSCALSLTFTGEVPAGASFAGATQVQNKINSLPR